MNENFSPEKPGSTIPVQIIFENEACIPIYSSQHAAGADVRAYIEKEISLEPGASILVPTGICVAIPEGFEIQVRPRSGLALKHQVTVLNTPGTIDSDYRGEIKVILINHSKQPFIITPGMRIAQIVLAPFFKAEFIKTECLATTLRGEGGFGHTGTN